MTGGALEVVALHDTNKLPDLQKSEFSSASHSITHAAYELMRDCMIATKYEDRRRSESTKEENERSRHRQPNSIGGYDDPRFALIEAEQQRKDKEISEHEGLSTESVFAWITE